jgi:hypothetical protein
MATPEPTSRSALPSYFVPVDVLSPAVVEGAGAATPPPPLPVTRTNVQNDVGKAKTINRLFFLAPSFRHFVN